MFYHGGEGRGIDIVYVNTALCHGRYTPNMVSDSSLETGPGERNRGCGKIKRTSDTPLAVYLQLGFSEGSARYSMLGPLGPRPGV